VALPDSRAASTLCAALLSRSPRSRTVGAGSVPRCRPRMWPGHALIAGWQARPAQMGPTISVAPHHRGTEPAPTDDGAGVCMTHPALRHQQRAPPSRDGARSYRRRGGGLYDASRIPHSAFRTVGAGSVPRCRPRMRSPPPGREGAGPSPPVAGVDRRDQRPRGLHCRRPGSGINLSKDSKKLVILSAAKNPLPSRSGRRRRAANPATRRLALTPGCGRPDRAVGAMGTRPSGFFAALRMTDLVLSANKIHHQPIK